MMRRFALVAVLAAAPAFGAAASDNNPAVERAWLNGQVWTGDPAHPWAEALAARGDRIVVVGTTVEVRKTLSPKAEVVDLHGRFVAPGFNDAHIHFLVQERAELDDVTSETEIAARLRAWAAAHPESPWILGRGWGYGAFGALGPRRAVLDAVVPDRPVFLNDRDGHSALVNSKALALAGITRATRDPVGGVVVKDASGEPTGLLKESAGELAGRLVPEPSTEERYQTLLHLLGRAASYGLTSVQNASFDEADWPAYERVAAEGRLTLRFYWSLPLVKDPSPEVLARYRERRDRYRGPLVKFGAIKGFVDGVIDARTAAMFEPYTSGGTGIANYTPEELNRAVAIYDREGFQVRLHAIGDRAIHMALDAYENAAKANGTTGRRHRVEHVELPLPADLPRFKALGVIASTQAMFANPDQTTLENFAVVLGPERASRADAFQRFDDAGAVQAFGSDWPVFTMEVLRGIHCAVTRTTAEGTPAGGWYPENRISAEAALSHFTRDAAYASFDEKDKGTLAVGKLADFVVLSEDIVRQPPDHILKARVLATVLGGAPTFKAKE
jgi:predicted amidohydrolase YtcJ